MLLGLVIASAGFSVLTAQTKAETLAVRGTVNANARSAYDVLVRPTGSVSQAEASDGLVQAQFLSGIQGGISMRQLHQIRRIPDVEVAAPVAVIGYVVPKVQVPVLENHRFALIGDRTLFRIRSTWHLDNGATVVRSAPRYQYVTAHELVAPRILFGRYFEVGPQGRKAITRMYDMQKTESSVRPPQIDLVARRRYLDPDPSPVADFAASAFLSDPALQTPFLLQAIDPVAEAQLSGLKTAMIKGDYLTNAPVKTRHNSQQVPVLVPTESSTKVTVSYRVDRLPAKYAEAFGNGHGLTGAATAPGTLMLRGRADQSVAFERFLKGPQLGSRSPASSRYATHFTQLFTVGQAQFQTREGPDGAVRVPARVRNRLGTWGNRPSSEPYGPTVPAGGDDTGFRTMAGYQWTLKNPRNNWSPSMHVVGRFDPARLPGFSSLSEVPLGTYAAPPLTGADAASRKALGDKPLPFSPNIAGYPQPAPLLLTSLSSLPVFEQDSRGWVSVIADRMGTPIAPVDQEAPLSSVRVRVAGVTGVDEVSRARVRLVAQRIRDRTGLQIDVTIGSSPSPQKIELAAGKYGRPELLLHENWVKKGTALVILKAVDKKSLALFLLVLVTCGLFVANAATASVQARRVELGVLACLGWAPGNLFRLVALELGLTAVTAGSVGAVLALVTGTVFDIPVGLGRALIAIPVAVAVVLLAGLASARAAAHAPPMEAARRTARLPKRAFEPRTVTGLAWVNLRRVPQRAVLAGIALTVAVAALVLVTGIQAAFQGAVVGTLLGDAVTIQVRGADIAAVAGICLLAGIGVANVTFLNLRERAGELATLRALGWGEGTLTRLLLIEATFIGLIAATLGAGLGVLGLGYGLDLPIHDIAAAAGWCWAAGILIAPAAALAPALSVTRLDTVTVLSEDY